MAALCEALWLAVLSFIYLFSLKGVRQASEAALLEEKRILVVS